MPILNKQISLTEAEIWDALNIFKSYRKDREHELSKVQKDCIEQDCIMCEDVAEIERQIATVNDISDKLARSLQTKTNKQWYLYEDLGAFYKLEDGTLMACAMLIDDSREDDPIEVTSWEHDDVGTGIT